MGNKSCFRNEKLNTKAFILTDAWPLPHSGLFEFDFMHLLDVPNPADVLADDQLHKLLEWFHSKSDVDKVEPLQLANTFAGISDFLTLRSDQLGFFVDLIDGKPNT